MKCGKGAILLLLPLVMLFVSGCTVTGAGWVSSLLSGGGGGLLGVTSDGSTSGGSYNSYASYSSYDSPVGLFSGTSGDPGTIGNLGGEDLGGNGSITLDVDNTPVLAHSPEPGSFLLFGTGLLGGAICRSRLRRLFKRK